MTKEDLVEKLKGIGIKECILTVLPETGEAKIRFSGTLNDKEFFSISFTNDGFERLGL
jgi:hypothetical protein